MRSFHQQTLLAWVFAGRLCDKYHNLMAHFILIMTADTFCWFGKERKMIFKMEHIFWVNENGTKYKEREIVF